MTLTVHERADITRNNEPVVCGVPLASTDNITSTANLGIFSSNELPAQFRVLSRYGGLPSDTDKPIRMLLCDVQVNLPASDSLTLYLKDTGSGTATGSNIASETNDHVILSTDSMTVKIRRTGYFNMFDEVWIDTTGDGNADSQVVSSNSTDGILVHANGKTYSSSNAAPTSITIEENGPLRAVVKVRGYYADSSGNFLVPSQGDVGLEYMVRIVA
ncbi:MAG: hypothetical protein SVY10_06450 [Thermodesulfobacteriota bacterium]|nr:hypothetical protein [Thermodesulfobacteriota bacterium]